MPRLGERLPSVRDRADRDRLIMEHRRLAYFAARRWGRQFGFDLEDAVAEANVALLRSAELWEQEVSGVFASYAVKAMFNHLLNLAKIERRRFSARKLAYTWDVQEDPRQPDPAEALAEREELQVLLEKMADALTKLDPRMRDVILARARGEKLKTVAERFGVSAQWIDRIEEKARLRLRHLLGVN